MSRLYTVASGDRGASAATRQADEHAFAEILYNYDGGNRAVGGMILRARVNKATKEITFELCYLSNIGERTLGTWMVSDVSAEEERVRIMDEKTGMFTDCFNTAEGGEQV